MQPGPSQPSLCGDARPVATFATARKKSAKTVTEEQEAHCDTPCHNSTDALKQWVKEADGKRCIFPQGGETYQIQSRDGREFP